MLQLQNRTPFAASISVFPNVDGVDTLYVNARATFLLGKTWQLADDQPLPTEVDEYYGDPLTTSVKSASDFHVGKTATDIVMQGSACAIDGRAVRELDVQLTVESASKAVRVFGDRVWDGRKISSPEMFESMPLVYERAFGGVADLGSEDAERFDKNPVGVGFSGNFSVNAVSGVPLPNIESPQDLIVSPEDTPDPAGFSFIAPFWNPRAKYAGTYDDEWELERAPYLPLNFDSRFLQAAPAELVYPGFISGGELVTIDGMHPRGRIQFNVPLVNIVCRVEIDSDDVIVPFRIETLLLHPNDLSVSLVWKAAYVCDKSLTKIKNIHLNLKR